MLKLELDINNTEKLAAAFRGSIGASLHQRHRPPAHLYARGVVTSSGAARAWPVIADLRLLMLMISRDINLLSKRGKILRH
jgi:hypothetical protein